MLTTIEMRWFYPGTIPPEIKQWFEENSLGGELQPPEEREDLYLYLANSESLGIKLRQGKLEIKWRKAKLGVVDFLNGWEGKAEKWSKWTCKYPTEESFISTTIREKLSWISVEKVRSQRKYQGFNFELTHLHIQGSKKELDKPNLQLATWWSLAFEVFDKDAKTREDLQDISSSFFKNYPDQKLKVNDSFAYPKWLSLVSMTS